MSSSFIGGNSSGSSYGSSSSGISGGSGSLTQSILGSVSLAAENVVLGGSSPSLSVADDQQPLTSFSLSGLTSGGTTTWIIVIVLVVVGFFAFREL